MPSSLLCCKNTALHDKKTDKYALLLRELQTLHPAASVRIVLFVLGSRFYLDEEHWAALWSTLKLKQAALVKLLPKVQAWNIEGADEMLSVRAAVQKGIGLA